MFGPTLTSAVQKARESAEGTRDELSNELHAAERMRHEADELDAEQAEEIIEDEYRPLMGDENDGGEGASGTESEGGPSGRSSGGKAKPRRRWDEGGDGEVKVRKLEVWLAQGIFFVRRRLAPLLPSSRALLTLDPLQVLGACILLSWNTTIVAGSYYGARLADSPFEASFASFNALTFTTANLVFLAHANATQGKVRTRLARQSSFMRQRHVLTSYPRRRTCRGASAGASSSSPPTSSSSSSRPSSRRSRRPSSSPSSSSRRSSLRRRRRTSRTRSSPSRPASGRPT